MADPRLESGIDRHLVTVHVRLREPIPPLDLEGLSCSHETSHWSAEIQSDEKEMPLSLVVFRVLMRVISIYS